MVPHKAMVSALTLFELDEIMARYASYEELAEIVRHRFQTPAETLRERFGRLVFNILCGNTDDYDRSHAAFCDGPSLTLTPAYDICPQARTGNEAGLAMLILGDNRASRLEVCIEAAGNLLLRENEAITLIEHQIQVIQEKLLALFEEGELGRVERNLLTTRQFLNPYVFENAPRPVTCLQPSESRSDSSPPTPRRYVSY